MRAEGKAMPRRRRKPRREARYRWRRPERQPEPPTRLERLVEGLWRFFFADRKRFIAVSIIVAPIVALFLVHREFIPLWDGGWIVQDLWWTTKDVMASKVFLQHMSLFHLAYLHSFWRLAPGSAPLVLLAYAILAAVAAIAFYGILRLVYRRPSGDVEVVLLSFLFACSPALQCLIYHPTLDMGVLANTLAASYFLLAGRIGWATVFGIALVFSKEIGLAIWGAAVVIYLLTHVTRDGPGLRGKGRRLLRHLPLFAPFCLYGLSLVWLRLLHPTVPNELLGQGHFTHHFNEPLWKKFVDLSPFSKQIGDFFTAIFIHNFHWVMSAFLTLWILRRAVRWLLRLTVPAPPACDGRHARYALAMLVATAYLVTRVRPWWLNARYVVATFPFLLLCFYHALLHLVKRAALRRGILAVLIGLTAASLFRTVDPVAKRICGTYPWGEHEILRSYGKGDPMVYNLEFLNLGPLQDMAFRAIDLGRDRPYAPIFVPCGAARFLGGWHLKRRRRTWHRRGPVRGLPVLPVTHFFNWRKGRRKRGRPLPDTIYFLRFPGLYTAKQLKVINGYDALRERIFRYDGYTMTLTEYRRHGIAGWQSRIGGEDRRRPASVR